MRAMARATRAAAKRMSALTVANFVYVERDLADSTHKGFFWFDQIGGGQC